MVGLEICPVALAGRLNILVLQHGQINGGARNCVLQLYLVVLKIEQMAAGKCREVRATQ